VGRASCTAFLFREALFEHALQPLECAFVLTSIPKTGNPKNKSQKLGMLLAAKKSPHNTPQKPRIPPQTHHDFTITKHHKIAKPLGKIPVSAPKYFSPKRVLPSLFRHQSR